ncbi:trehalose 6-phosphate synthase [Amycolatopsis xylanica]|uniref:Trehalose 6-phosphate synthase n=1 Tax=Amycolatopsis xylanica TaxID=589385 RepID=A0A1H3SFH7_9PSEU|nr:trehalose-6-phosphate synthase [Amycolatopsis xylanica]SDZ36497.1 trehalose 6-phosphate synthase [Amycolatopsis xylanica]
MRILTCSNSCPRWDADTIAPRSPGGLAPMVVSLLNEHGGHWIFTAPPDQPGVSSPIRIGDDIWLHPVEPGEELRHQHYDVISIRLLLGLLHYMHDTSEQPVFDSAMVDAWAGYEAVNQSYAKRLREVSDNSAGDELILINDPHLMLVPEYFAETQAGRASRMTYFLGTPWCEPDYFSLIPGHIRTRILTSLLRCDVVGFHAGRWVDAFLACCARYVPGARVEGRTVILGEHRTELIAMPFPLDTDVLDRMTEADATRRWQSKLAELAGGRKLMLRADRLDLWKNIPRGFQAYEMALERRPELAEQCWFAAVVTTPSRAAGRHQAYAEATEAVVRRINDRFATGGREAVSLIRPGMDDDSRNCVVAGLLMSTAAVVNSTYDGLNLFAKEAAYLLDDDASLLLSANAGADEQLGPFTVTVDPFDLGQTSEAMEKALTGSGGSGRDARRALLRDEHLDGWLTTVFRLG